MPGAPIRASSGSRMSRHSADRVDGADAQLPRAAGNLAPSPRHTRIARAVESIATSRQFSGRSSTSTSSASAAAILPREPWTTKTDGGKPVRDSQRWLCACAVSPAVSGRLVRKISSQRRSAPGGTAAPARPARFRRAFPRNSRGRTRRPKSRAVDARSVVGGAVSLVGMAPLAGGVGAQARQPSAASWSGRCPGTALGLRVQARLQVRQCAVEVEA